MIDNYIKYIESYNYIFICLHAHQWDSLCLVDIIHYVLLKYPFKLGHDSIPFSNFEGKKETNNYKLRGA